MIGRIRGTLAHKQPPLILVEVGGVGYEIQVPMTTLFQLPDLGEPVSLVTHFVVREDAQLLYGFIEERDRTLFRKLIKVNVRVIAASNKDLRQEIEKGAFREDLFYRLNVLPIDVPPLRNRCVDIPVLVRHFLRIHAEEQGMKLKDITDGALDILARHDWPGNIRELRNQVERLMIMVPKAVIETADVIPFMPGRADGAVQRVSALDSYDSLREARHAFEREYITHRLRDNAWNVSKTADDLKIERSHLHRKIKLLNVDLRPEA